MISGTHADAMAKLDGASLSAVMDVVPEKAKALGDKYGVPSFTSPKAFLSVVDAVTVCTPSGYHSKVGIACAKAGKHVLSEKPIDTTFAKAQKLVDTCKQEGVKLGVISQHRFSRAIQRVRHAAQGGEFGKLLTGDAYIKWYRTQAYYDSGDWRGTIALDGGGCLINQGVHYIDMLQWIMGGVASVQAQTRTAAHQIEVEDIANALIEYKNGAVGVIQGTTCAYPGMQERIEVSGLYGSAFVEGDVIKVWESDPTAPASKSPYGRELKYHPLPTVSILDPKENPDDPTAKWGVQHQLQIQDFVDAIRENRDPFVTGEAALEPLKVILGIYKSSKMGGKRLIVNV
jgi:predicted dehydrogenase